MKLPAIKMFAIFYEPERTLVPLSREIDLLCIPCAKIFVFYVT